MSTTTVDHAVIDERVHIAEEVVAGTRVAALLRVPTLRWRIDDEGGFTQFRARGGVFPVVNQVGILEAKLALEESSADYLSLPLVLNGAWGKATPTNVGSATKRRVWTLPLYGIPRGQTYSIEEGDTRYARRVAYGTVTGYKFMITPQKVTIAGEGIAKAYDISEALSTNARYQSVVSGTDGTTTFTYTLGGQTTTPLTLGAADAAAVRAALEALSTVGANNVVVIQTVAGSNSDTWTIEFVEAKGQQALTLTGTASGGTSPSNVITSQRTGATPTDLAVQPFDPNSVLISLADTTAGLDSAVPLDRNFEFSHAMGGLREGFHPIGNNASGFRGVAGREEPTSSAELVLDLQTGRSLRTQMAAGAIKYLRCVATGPNFATGEPFKSTLDLALFITQMPTREEVESLRLERYGFMPAAVSAWGKAGVWTVDNNLASY